MFVKITQEMDVIEIVEINFAWIFLLIFPQINPIMVGTQYLVL